MLNRVASLLLRLQMSSSVKKAGLSFRGTATCTSLTERRGWRQSSAAATSTRIWPASSPQRSRTLSTVSTQGARPQRGPPRAGRAHLRLFCHSKLPELPVDRAERQDGSQRLPLDRRHATGEWGPHTGVLSSLVCVYVASTRKPSLTWIQRDFS